jgi:hypothetical protein
MRNRELSEHTFPAFGRNQWINSGKPRNGRLSPSGPSGHVPNTADFLTVIAEETGGGVIWFVLMAGLKVKQS